MPGLNVSDVVKVAVNMSPVAIPVANFGAMCIAGTSPVIDTNERIREYATLDEVVADFGSAAPEYLAADLFFSQSPQPSLLYIGRFAQNGSNAVLHGGIMTASQQAALLTSLQGVSTGTMEITVDGTVRTVANSPAELQSGAFTIPAQATLLSSLQALNNGAFAITVGGTVVETGLIDFTPITDLPGAAALINTALGANAHCAWQSTSGQFIITSVAIGASATIGYAQAPATGTDISATLHLTSASGALPPINGTAGMNFTSVTNLNGAATIITNALVGATCVFDGERFSISSLSSGINSSISYASPAGTGTDVSGLLRLTQATGANAPVNGIAAETALACATALRAFPEWYCLSFAAVLTDQDHEAVAGFIEGANPISIYAVTTQDDHVLDPTVNTDLCSSLMLLSLKRTFTQFSSTNPYAAVSFFGRASTVDFQGSNTVITMKFKQEPNVQVEVLTETEAATLRAKHCNAFVAYSNGAYIIQEGVMANGYFFDEVQGTDWLANQVQTDLFNVLYTSSTKIPQTNQGIHILVATVSSSIQLGVQNGLIAGGQWNAAGFGQLSQGQMLPAGYYVWAPLLETQPQSIREQRIAPTIQAAIKLAGAVHFAGVTINVNR